MKINKYYKDMTRNENEFYEKDRAEVINNNTSINGISYPDSTITSKLDSLEEIHNNYINSFESEKKRLKSLSRKERKEDPTFRYITNKDGDRDGDGVIDVPDIHLDTVAVADTDGDGIPDDKDMCPTDYGQSPDGCPNVLANIISSKAFMIEFEPVLVKDWDDFIKKNPMLKDNEIMEFVKNKYPTIIEYNVGRIQDFYSTGMITRKQFDSYLKRAMEGEVFPVELKEYGYYWNNKEKEDKTWIPNIENMNIVDKADADSTSSKGTIAYSVPDEMTVGEKYKITVRISKKKGTEIKKTLVLGEQEIPISDPDIESKVVIENIRVDKTMTVQLLSQDGTFEISPTSTETQVLEDESYTEWSWVVKPLISGTSYLKMIIKIKIQAGDETSYKDIVVFDKNIKVNANMKLEVKSWLSQYWQWLMTTIIIPLVAFFYKSKKKKKEEKKEEQPEEQHKPKKTRKPKATPKPAAAKKPRKPKK